MKSCLKRRNFVAVLVCMAVLGFGAEVAKCDTIIVKADGTGDYPTIQDAINASINGDIIEVAPGTYTGINNRDIDFLGKAITVRSTDPNDPAVVAATVIDCERGYHDPHRGFKFHSGEGPDSVLAGITITNGYGLKYMGVSVGGAIFCYGSSPTITKCNITDTMAEWGGGICCWQSSPTIKNCTITSNWAGEKGGGIFCYYSSPTINNCTISLNFARDGGGIHCHEQSDPNITACTISSNSAGYGGGIYCSSWESNPTITDCVISDNRASDGGGIFDCWGPITNCTIIGNSAHHQGGGLCECYGPVTDCIITDNIAEEGGGLARCASPLTGCVISNNTAEDGGGGFSMCYDGPIINCIINDNTAGRFGGGVLSFNGPIINCTIAGNTAVLQGGGLDSCGGPITNCILRDNRPQQIGGSASVAYSNVQDGWEGEGNIDAAPVFALDTDYHLMPGSPGIDAGTNDPCGGLPPTDKDGVARPLDGDGDGSAVADMGAYEYALNSPSIAVSAVSFYFVQDWPRPDPQTLQIRNCGGQPLQWEIVEDCSWLEAAPANGVSTNQINEVTLTVDPNGLMPGLYSYDFKVQDANASNSPVTIRVTVPVGTVLNVPSPNYPTIQSAIDAAGYYDVVVVADGNYTGAGNKNLDFHGKPLRVRSENGPNNCTIDCQNSGGGFVFWSGERENSVVEGFTITDAGNGITCQFGTSPVINNCTIREGSHPGVVSQDYSSPTITNCTISGNNCGILCDSGSNATIKNCTISNNSEWRGVGGIYFWGWGSSLEIVNCTISANNGIGIYGNRYCNLEITDCTISENDGGGIYGEFNHSVKITNCTISDNNNTGIRCEGDSTTITNCTINGNKNGYLGGGIYCGVGYRTTISNCTISDNSAEFIGGVGCGGLITTITNCIISGNSATDGIGGAYISGFLSSTINNCLIIGNTAERGGGLCCSGYENPTVTNCTIVGNSASSPEWGGGMLCINGNPTITNCIFWGNEAPKGAQIYLTDSDASVSYTDVEGGEDDVYVEPGSILNWGLGNIDLDPYFVDPNVSDYHLSEDSPCIDAGDPNYVAGPDETDLDGNPRVFGDRIDMGAYELFNTPPVACIVGGDRTVEAGIGCEAKVTLDGSCSSDADSTPGTNDDIVSFDWYEGDTFLGSGEIIECNLPLGEHTIILEVIDKAGAFDSNEVTIIVEDTTPPEFTLSVTPNVLWPPNRRMVKITPSWEVSDNCDELPDVTLVSITMNEDDDAKGNGHRSDDIRVKPDGSIYLRAERSGKGTGRIYTITYRAVDDSGNVTQKSTAVTVPHNRVPAWLRRISRGGLRHMQLRRLRHMLLRRLRSRSRRYR
ncbi:MAG: right-handed parallel beta-helix repeat-containing protein [Planctomycetota bacterium]